jgi:MscS family membrane protein
MNWRDPRLVEGLISVLILASSYLAARALSYLFARVFAKLAERTTSTLDDRLVSALQRPVTYALFLVGAYVAVHRLPVEERWIGRLDGVLVVVGMLLLTVGLARAYGILLNWYTTESKRAPDGTLAAEFGPLFSKVGKLFITVVAVITVLQHFGVNVASLVVSLGVGSLAVGLAAQDTLSNMFAGFTLMLDRPFRVGDRIQLATGEVGDVEAIGIRATRMRTPDDTALIVPNSLLVKERLVNLSQPARFIITRVEVAVAYGSDLAQVKRILHEAALSSKHVLADRPPTVLVNRLGDYAISLQVVFWARDYLEQGLARSEVHEEVYRRLNEAGIEIPLPTSKVIHEGPASDSEDS